MTNVVDIREAVARRAPLYDIAIERGLASALLVHPDLLEKLDPEFDTHKLFDLHARCAIEAVINLIERKIPIDVDTVRTELGRCEKLGNPAWFEALTRVTPAHNETMVRGWSTAIVRFADRRDVLVETGEERARAEAEVDEIALRDVDFETKPVTEDDGPPPGLMSIRESMEELAALASMPIYPTPFPTLNDAIGFGGFIGTQGYTVSAGTGRGKTSFVAALAAHAAISVPVVVATYEMKPGYFVARKAAGVLGVHSNSIIRGHVSVDAVCNALPLDRLFLMKRPGLKELRRAVAYLTKKHGIAPLVIVDYLQKLATMIARQQARPDLRMATSEASETLLDIGEATGAAIVAVSSVGRGKGSIMKDPRKHSPYELVEVAKESGDVEYDGAGVIVLNLSDDYDGELRVGTATVAKARFGTEMHIDMRYHGPRGDWNEIGQVAKRKPGTSSITSTITPASFIPANVVRDALLQVLRTYGDQPSASKLANLSGKNRQAAMDELKILLRDGTVEKDKRGFIGLPKPKPPQLEVLIGRAEQDVTP